MPELSARAGLSYATDDEMLKLYGVLVGGWIAMLVGQFAVAGPISLLSLVGFLVTLGGVFAFLVGVVAVLHKVLADS
jgi:hypothetical protein